MVFLHSKMSICAPPVPLKIAERLIVFSRLSDADLNIKQDEKSSENCNACIFDSVGS